MSKVYTRDLEGTFPDYTIMTTNPWSISEKFYKSRFFRFKTLYHILIMVIRYKNHIKKGKIKCVRIHFWLGWFLHLISDDRPGTSSSSRRIFKRLLEFHGYHSCQLCINFFLSYIGVSMVSFAQCEKWTILLSLRLISDQILLTVKSCVFHTVI